MVHYFGELRLGPEDEAGTVGVSVCYRFDEGLLRAITVQLDGRARLFTDIRKLVTNLAVRLGGLMLLNLYLRVSNHIASRRLSGFLLRDAGR